MRSGRALAPPVYPRQIQRADLEPYCEGGSGVDYVHRIDSGAPGLHVMVNALTHGNEWCGMQVVKRLIDLGLEPRAGRLTLSFANIAAYDTVAPDGSSVRFVDRDFNRLWNDDLLAADVESVEAKRAHAMRPIVATVDRLLDLHSTWHALQPFFVMSQLPRVRQLADRLACPPRQLFLPTDAWHEGYHLIDYGAFRDPDSGAIGLIAECGQHFAQSSVETAWAAAIRFLQVVGTIDDATAARLCPQLAPGENVERYEIVQPVMAQTDDLLLTGSYAGFGRFAQGELAAMDGDRPILAPFDGAVLLAPRPEPRAGQQAFAWGREVACSP